MMKLKLPDKALVNKFIAKNKFYERVQLNSRLQNEFIRKIQRITWKYKLAEETIGASKSDNVSEIQIFEIELKEKDIPKNAIKIIDKAIPYHILYIFIHNDDFAFGISLKENGAVRDYYFSQWNKELNFDFGGYNLENIYQNIIKEFIEVDNKNVSNFLELVELDKKIKTLENEIKTLRNKIKKEKQFNRKVELNSILLSKEKDLKRLREQL